MNMTKNGVRYRMDLDDYERRTLIGILAAMRNQCLQDDTPTEDVNNLIVKAMDANEEKPKKNKGKDER